MKTTFIKVIKENEITKQIITYVYKNVTLKTIDGDVIIPADSILGIEVMGKRCCVYTSDGKYDLKIMPMCRLLEAINHPTLVRCHKSYTVNLNHIKGTRMVYRNIWHVIFDCETSFKCKISKTYYNSIFN